MYNDSPIYIEDKNSYRSYLVPERDTSGMECHDGFVCLSLHTIFVWVSTYLQTVLLILLTHFCTGFAVTELSRIIMIAW